MQLKPVLSANLAQFWPTNLSVGTFVRHNRRVLADKSAHGCVVADTPLPCAAYLELDDEEPLELEDDDELELDDEEELLELDELLDDEDELLELDELLDELEDELEDDEELLELEDELDELLELVADELLLDASDEMDDSLLDDELLESSSGSTMVMQDSNWVAPAPAIPPVSRRRNCLRSS